MKIVKSLLDEKNKFFIHKIHILEEYLYSK